MGSPSPIVRTTSATFLQPAKGQRRLVIYSILIADDSALIRETLRTYIEAKTEWRICGEAENGKIAVDKVQELRPNVVVLDFQMPVMNGLDAARLIRKSAPNAAIVMLTMHESAQLRSEDRNAGVEDVVSKSNFVLKGYGSSNTSGTALLGSNEDLALNT